MRLEAIRRLEGDAALASIAVSDAWADIRVAAIRRLGDVRERTKYRNLSEEDRQASYEIRQSAFLTIALTAQPDEAFAAVKLLDRELGRVAVESKHPEVRKVAMTRVRDPQVLAKMALTDRDSGIRLDAIGRVTDAAELQHIMLASTDPYVRSAAARRIEDQPFIERIAKTEGDPNVQLAIGERLTNEQALDELAMRAKDPRTRCIVARVENLSTLSAIVGDFVGHGIAELKYLMRHNLVKHRVPDLTLTCTREIIPVYYRAGRDQYRVDGERVTLKLLRGGVVMMERSWASQYRERINELHIDSYVKSGRHAEIDVRPFAEALLDAAKLTPSEVDAVTMALLPTGGVGKALVARITNVASLRKLVVEYEAYGIREDVKARLAALAGQESH